MKVLSTESRMMGIPNPSQENTTQPIVGNVKKMHSKSLWLKVQYVRLYPGIRRLYSLPMTTWCDPFAGPAHCSKARLSPRLQWISLTNGDVPVSRRQSLMISHLSSTKQTQNRRQSGSCSSSSPLHPLGW